MRATFAGEIISKMRLSMPKGLFPVMKRSGVTTNQVCRWIALQLRNDLDFEHHSVEITSFGTLPLYSSGVLSIGLGRYGAQLKYLCFCEIQQEIDIRLGLSSNNSFIQSGEVARKAYDHITLETLQSTLKPFICRQIQTEVDSMNDRNPLLPAELILVDESVEEKYDTDWAKVPGKPMVPRRELFRETEITALEVKNFNPPDFTLKVSSIGPISIPRFIFDLCNALNTVGTITRHVKTKEGPFMLKDCLSQVDFHYKYLDEHLRRYTPIFKEHMLPHQDKIQVIHERRLW
ncbi:pseudouridylate synthase TRUB1-like [Brevipalpus obovatus]|uniref:pseudouridylate synthase TRUB1-like n=1 Tax=Brevipalpus obovatus TaxID=246614 RepID=UPI003D9DD032